MNYRTITASLALAVAMGFGTANAQQPSKAPDTSGAFSGKVTETMDTGEYTYVRVDTGKTNVWAAAPKFSVKVGDTATIPAGMAMPQYHSKTLNKDFDLVYFTDRVEVNGGAKNSAATPALQELPKGHPPIGGQAVPNTKVDLSGIKKAEGGETIAQIYADKTKLSGKHVKVRGKVVKYNGNILGKNWLHLRDGTGAEGSNDLLVTTSAEAKIGDTVVATGTLALNKDFGANYKYAVMIEEAQVKVE